MNLDPLHPLSMVSQIQSLVKRGCFFYFVFGSPTFFWSRDLYKISTCLSTHWATFSRPSARLLASCCLRVNSGFSLSFGKFASAFCSSAICSFVCSSQLTHEQPANNSGNIRNKYFMCQLQDVNVNHAITSLCDISRVFQSIVFTKHVTYGDLGCVLHQITLSIVCTCGFLHQQPASNSVTRSNKYFIGLIGYKFIVLCIFL